VVFRVAGVFWCWSAGPIVGPWRFVRLLRSRIYGLPVDGLRVLLRGCAVLLPAHCHAEKSAYERHRLDFRIAVAALSVGGPLLSR
jgi:hypothetical protein